MRLGGSWFIQLLSEISTQTKQLAETCSNSVSNVKCTHSKRSTCYWKHNQYFDMNFFTRKSYENAVEILKFSIGWQAGIFPFFTLVVLTEYSLAFICGVVIRDEIHEINIIFERDKRLKNDNFHSFSGTISSTLSFCWFNWNLLKFTQLCVERTKIFPNEISVENSRLLLHPVFYLKRTRTQVENIFMEWQIFKSSSNQIFKEISFDQCTFVDVIDTHQKLNFIGKLMHKNTKFFDENIFV